ncbi:MAG: glycosyltransferase family 4 protein [Hyphomicrobiaceae bacterium]
MADQAPTILQIVPRLDTGGAELSTLEIVEALVRAGGRALVATEGGRMAERITALGGEIITLPLESKNPVTILANGLRLARLVHARSVALLHARSRAPAWSALIAARQTGAPFVTTYHGAYGERGRLKRFYNSVMARGDVVIANSRYTADLIRARYGALAGTPRIIPRGVDIARFSPAAVAAERRARLRAAWRVGPDQRVILHAARLTSWKGQRFVIAAVGRLHAEGRLGDAVLVLAGDAQGRDDYAEGLSRLAADLGVGDRVRLVGHVDDIAAAFALAHVTVVASIEPEAFGRAAAEALAVGCPTITTNIGAPPEIVLAPPEAPPDQATGWHVPPSDAAALAEALADALAMPEIERAAMSARAIASIAARFTVAEMQRQTLAVYDGLLGTDLARRFG